MSENSHGETAENFGPPEKLSFLNYVQLFSSISINYVRQTADKVIILAAIYSVFSLLAYFLYLLIKTYVRDEQNESMKRVLIVTAHPDDECMFFGPTIVNLRSRNIPVHLLCLSPGDSAPNSRQVRKTELWQSCKALGLDTSLVELKKHTLLMDGHGNEWSHKLIAKMILSTIDTMNIDTVITFDETGVSEHPNHVAIFNAMAYLTLNHLLPTNVGFYSLDSVNKLRKFSFMLDFLTSFFLSELCLTLSLKQQCQVVKAMSCHQSQFVWYRKFYILLSRYATINTLKTWTPAELKYCLKYQEIVDGMKYKSKWYESLDDSLKKINSEQTFSTLAKSDEFTAEETTDGAEDDSDVSFVAKRSATSSAEPSAPPVPETQTRDLSTPSPQPEPDPTTLGVDESIHNGKVYVRKSRFLIPKTYGSFYNSSSSETSDDKDDGETSSSSNTSLDRIKPQDSEDTPPTPSSISSETSGQARHLDTQSSEEMTSEDGRDTVNIKNTYSDTTLPCTDTDMTLDMETLDDEMGGDNLSYEIEDIESVLDEIDEDLDDKEDWIESQHDDKNESVRDVLIDIINKTFDKKNGPSMEEKINCDSRGDLIVEYDGQGNKLDKRHEDVENVNGESRGNESEENVEEAFDVNGDCESSELQQRGEKRSVKENVYCAVEDDAENNRDWMNLGVINSNSHDGEGNGNHLPNSQTKHDGEVQTARAQEVTPPHRGGHVDGLSSNSSEQESALDEQPSDAVSNAANNLNKRNKKRRKNKKNRKEKTRATGELDKQDEARDGVDSTRYVAIDKPVHVRDKNENTLLAGPLDGVDYEQSRSTGVLNDGHGAGKLARANLITAAVLGENNQNVFNVELVGNVCTDDELATRERSAETNAVLQPVGTN